MMEHFTLCCCLTGLTGYYVILYLGLYSLVIFKHFLKKSRCGILLLFEKTVDNHKLHVKEALFFLFAQP